LLRLTPIRWWRLPASAVALVLTFAAASLATGGLVAVVSAVAGVDVRTEDGPIALLAVNLVLAGGIVASFAAVRLGFGRPGGRVSSVAGRLRWKWLLRCLAACTAVTVVAVVVHRGAAVATGGSGSAGTSSHEPQWLALLAITLLTTPLQCAGEEYVFRGWLPQVFGAVVSNATVSLLLGGAVSTVLFTLLHGEQNPWLFAHRFAFGALAYGLVWSTGGLEAGIALHVVNNVTAETFGIVSGDLSERLSETEIAFVDFAVGDLVTVFAVVAMLFLARRHRPARLHTGV
jgi:membrane protease YdiL (CAAX protease family)